MGREVPRTTTTTTKTKEKEKAILSIGRTRRDCAFVCFVSFRFVSIINTTLLPWTVLGFRSQAVVAQNTHTHTHARTKRRFRLEEYDREGSRAQCPCGLGFRQLGSNDAHAEPRDRISEREKGKGKSSRGTYKSEARHTWRASHDGRDDDDEAEVC